MKCKNCSQEIDKKAVVCPGCGCKVKKPIYKKWWFWAIIAVVIIAVGSSAGNEPATSDTNTGKVAEEIVYEVANLQTMFDELHGNALKAEKTYNNKYVEVTGKISNFDSDGSYINIEAVNANEWNLDTAMCYIKNDDQLNFLLEKNVGDIVTIKGKIKSVGEVLGYSIDINEVQ